MIFTILRLTGHAGKRTTRGRIRGIAALDPAGPLFSLDNPAERLHSTGKKTLNDFSDFCKISIYLHYFTDADHVESLVTDAGRLGFEHPIGHANFYPNWGKEILQSLLK